jgi:NAD(P)-dependent dehydrogenase (short-subunit alcohol dehydrogenase family)
MKVANSTVLISGANRGLGKALVEEALKRGATRVYAGTRKPVIHPDQRVTPLELDVTKPANIMAATERVLSLDILINNAGMAVPDDLTDRAMLQRHLDVKLFGMNALIQAFLPLLVHSRGAIVNVVSRAAFAPLPLIPAYSISDAAAFSLTQSYRRLLAGRVSVHAVVPGSISTDMSRGFNVPKSSPESVAGGILDGLEIGEEEIFPDPMSAAMAEGWRNGVAKALERQFAALIKA